VRGRWKALHEIRDVPSLGESHPSRSDVDVNPQVELCRAHVREGKGGRELGNDP
jgi:hypothetical protein